jgi:hypothetical protein
MSLKLTARDMQTRQFCVWGALAGLILLAPGLRADDEDEDSSPKGASQALNDFIGDWKGVGGPETRGSNREETWQEQVSWSWRFKGDDVALTMTIKSGKHLKRAELRYRPTRNATSLRRSTKTIGGRCLRGKTRTVI